MIPNASDWYAYYFGSELANSAEFDAERLLERGEQECRVLLADFCSFTTFMRATENIKVVEPILTSFYTEARKAIHRHSGMLYQIVGDSVVGVWGLHSTNAKIPESVLEAARALVAIAKRVADDWQAHIDLLVEPKGLRLGLSKGAIAAVRRDGVYPGLLLFGNAINLAARLQAAAGPNELVCSNSAYKEIQDADLKLPFQPYGGNSNPGSLEARNYGPIKAWTLNLA
jgi:adenylate cyclase